VVRDIAGQIIKKFFL